MGVQQNGLRDLKRERLVSLREGRGVPSYSYPFPPYHWGAGVVYLRNFGATLLPPLATPPVAADN